MKMFLPLQPKTSDLSSPLTVTTSSPYIVAAISHNGIIICKTDRDYVGQTQTLHAYLQGIES